MTSKTIGFDPSKIHEYNISRDIDAASRDIDSTMRTKLLLVNGLSDTPPSSTQYSCHMMT
jgi:hypothetical protein